MEFLEKKIFRVLLSFCIVCFFNVFNAQGQIVSDDLIFLCTQNENDLNKETFSGVTNICDIQGEAESSQRKKRIVKIKIISSNRLEITIFDCKSGTTISQHILECE